MLHKFFTRIIDMTTLCFGGGGGGGSTTTNSGGNDTLWNAQANKVNQDMAMSAQMFDTYQKYAPGYLEKTNQMNTDAQSGALTARARASAGADADQATASGLAAANRSLERYGSTMNPNALASTSRATALQSAANKAGAMSRATQWGENQKWARNQDALAAASGQQGNAVAMSQNANQGFSTLGSMQNSQNYMDSQNASGAGKFGAYAASSLFKADGGYIEVPHKRTLRLADGGSVNPVTGWRERMASMPAISRSTTNAGSAGQTLRNVVSGAAPVVAGELAKPYLKQGLGSAKDALARYSGEARSTAERLAGIDQTQAAADVIDKSSKVVDVAADTAPAAAVEGATDAATASAAGEAAATDAATAAATQAAAETAAAQAAATAAASEVSAAEVLPLLLLQKGGAVQRHDLRGGGNVAGPGTETSDSVPAQLSDGEFVLNAEAVKMIGKGRLEELNAKGLRQRRDEGKTALSRVLAAERSNIKKGLRNYG